MRQTKLGSLIESTLNILSGFFINVAIGVYLFPFFGFNITWNQSFAIGVIYTIIAIARSYIWRRIFNHIKL